MRLKSITKIERKSDIQTTPTWKNVGMNVYITNNKKGGINMYTVKLKKEVTRKNLRVGSVLEDLNGERHTVIRLDDYFIVTTYGKGENWLVDSHLKYESLIKY